MGIQTYIRRNITAALATASCLVLSTANIHADDWMTWSSTYTHRSDGQRVDQYAQAVAPLAPDRSGFQRSGYRNFRSTLQVGQSADNLHIVEQWGRPVVPYEQWRFPFRPYAVPYDAWGPQAPYGIINGNFNYGYPQGLGFQPGFQPGIPNPGLGGGPSGRPGVRPGFAPGLNQQYPGYGPSNGFPLQPQYRNQPWFDGTYPDAPPLDPRSDEEFFYRPGR